MVAAACVHMKVVSMGICVYAWADTDAESKMMKFEVILYSGIGLQSNLIKVIQGLFDKAISSCRHQQVPVDGAYRWFYRPWCTHQGGGLLHSHGRIPCRQRGLAHAAQLPNV